MKRTGSQSLEGVAHASWELSAHGLGVVPAAWLLVLLGFAASATRADTTLAPLPGEADSARTARRLEDADKLAAAGQWADAIAEFQHVLDEAGNDLVPVDAAKLHWVHAGRLCRLRLAALPPAALRLYRERVDGQARKWLDEGLARRDVRLLRRVVDEAFCSRSGDRALDALGDLAFERGDFDEAQGWWRYLADETAASRQTAGPNGEPAAPFPVLRSPLPPLRFPDPQVDVARVRAKQILARLIGGEKDGIDAALSAYRSTHGKAEGDLAGRRGNYADILADLVRQPDLAVTPRHEPAWPTFAGDPSRNSARSGRQGPNAAAGPVPWGGPSWSVPLKEAAGPAGAPDDGKVLTPGAAAKGLAAYPVIAAGQVFVADAHSVTAHDLFADGRRTGKFELAEHDLDTNQPGGSFTLTVAGDYVYARLGSPVMRKRTLQEKPVRLDSFLVCLRLRPEPDGKLVPRWPPIRSSEEGKPPNLFEGAPVVQDGRVYIARTRFDEAVGATAVECYRADTGALLWHQEVCRDAPAGKDELANPAPRSTDRLLTLAGRHVVYASHRGAIVAMDAATGRPVWAVRYPSRGSRVADGNGSPRDLAPCVYARESGTPRLFAAPADYDGILCLDPGTGDKLWEREHVEAIQLIGAAGSRLIFSTATPSPGIRAVYAATGADVPGWFHPETGDLPPFGRGLLAGGLVYWPTWPTGSGGTDLNYRLILLHQEDGRPEAVLRFRQPVGNLAFADGCLAGAGPDKLWAYVPEAHRLEQRRREAAAQPGSAAARYRLAVAEASAGLYREAADDFARAGRLAPPEEMLLTYTCRSGDKQQTPLRDLARSGKHQALLNFADQEQRQGHCKKAATILSEAALPEFPVTDRLRALNGCAGVWTRAGLAGRAVAIWQSILTDVDFRAGRIDDPAGNPEPAALVAADRIGELIRAHGPGVYEEFERQARERFTAAHEGNRTEVLEQIARDYPVARVTGAALQELAERHEQAGRYGAAGRAYRRLLECSARSIGPVRSSTAGGGNSPAGQLSATDLPPEWEARTWAGMARCYERQHCSGAARVAWQHLAEKYGELRLAAVDPDRTLGQFVTEHLRKSMFHPPECWPKDAGPPSLKREWEVPLPPSAHLLVPARGPSPSDNPGVFFFARGLGTDAVLSCASAETGKTLWERRLDERPSWIGFHADTVMAAGAGGVRCLSLADGEVCWDFSAEPAWAGPLAEFRLTPSRLYFLQGGQRLLALDAESGRVLWNRHAPGAVVQPRSGPGRFGPTFYAGEGSVVIQPAAGQCWVLDPVNGRRAYQPVLGDKLETFRWPRPPVPVGPNRLGLVTGLQTVILLDTAAGKRIWSRHTPKPSVNAVVPQLLSDGKVLLLLIDGWQLERLDPLTGAPLWSCALGSEPVDLDPDHGSAALDGAAFYYVGRGVLHARSLADGRRLWKSTLLAAHAEPWRVACPSGSVLVFAARPEPTRRRAWLMGGYLVAVPAQIQWQPFLLESFDPRDGSRIQDLSLAREGTGGGIAMISNGAEGLFVAEAGGHAWGLDRKRKRD